jgi:hypothetical protein
MKDEHLKVLRHMLGINDPYMAKPESYRDYYCANIGNKTLHELKKLGMVRLYFTCDKYEWFTTTDLGKSKAIESFWLLQKPKKARRYLCYLKIKEVNSQLTFKDFLTLPEFKPCHANC